ncbi:MAG: hypothetical protein HC906_02780 [Bacteroidales bacterium]|nr:hypothetical protein [Bacteroidales bacterium]
MIIHNCSFQQIKTIQLNHYERTELLEYITEYYSLHFAGLKNMKSLAVLKELFGSN